MTKKQLEKKKAAAYVVDTQPGNHSYAFVEGVGECRANFMWMVEGIDKGDIDVVLVMKAELLFIDTSPLWLENFVVTVKRHHILIVDTTRDKEYDLRKPEDEREFRELRTK
jgi:hypothetical protein